MIDAEKIHRTIGANVKAYRTALGMTAAELAEKLQTIKGDPVRFPRQTIYTMEVGERKFGAVELVALTRALGVSMSDLFLEVPDPEPSPEPMTPSERLAAAKGNRRNILG